MSRPPELGHLVSVKLRLPDVVLHALKAEAAAGARSLPVVVAEAVEARHLVLHPGDQCYGSGRPWKSQTTGARYRPVCSVCGVSAVALGLSGDWLRSRRARRDEVPVWPGHVPAHASWDAVPPG